MGKISTRKRRVIEERLAFAKLRLATNEIPDFSHRRDIKKREDFASSLCFLNEFYRYAHPDESTRSVVCNIHSSIDDLVNRVLSTRTIIPPQTMIPAWESAPPSVWLAYYHAILLLRQGGVHWCYTVFLKDAMVETALNGDKSPASYYQDRVQRQLKKLGHAVFWQCAEIKIKNVSRVRGVVQLQSFHHLHGALHISAETSEYDVRKALRLAAGEFPPKQRGTQAILKPPLLNRELEWAHFYCRKQAHDLMGVYGKRPFNYSQELTAPAQRLYEASRQRLNQMRRVLS